MIELTPLARPYAKALFATSKDSNNLDPMAEELKIIATVFKTDAIIKTIENPALSKKEIVETITKLLEESISDTSRKLLEILAENKRLNLLESIYLIFQDLLEKHNSQSSIEVFVPVDPGTEAKEAIEDKLKLKYGEDANIYFSKDPKMMGGLSIKVGDETLDLSIRGKVNKLINQLNL